MAGWHISIARVRGKPQCSSRSRVPQFRLCLLCYLVMQPYGDLLVCALITSLGLNSIIYEMSIHIQ